MCGAGLLLKYIETITYYPDEMIVSKPKYIKCIGSFEDLQ